MSDNFQEQMNPQLGSPDGPVPEDHPAQQLEHLHNLSPDPELPAPATYNTLPEPIPAFPGDLSTTAIAVAKTVAWDDIVGYSQAYMDAINAASQDQIGTGNDDEI